MLNAGDIFNSPIGKLQIEEFIGKGKSGHSYLATKTRTKVVLKIMHDETSPYYHFSKNKADLEVNAYKTLLEVGINMPKLLHFDLNNKYIVKEYIEGKTAAQIIAKGELTDSIIAQLFTMSHRIRTKGFNIDFFPTNFVISGDKLYYIDYEVNFYEHRWSLDNWGIYYWANSEGFEKFLETGDANYINEDLNKGLPHKNPFEEKVNDWKAKFAIH